MIPILLLAVSHKVLIEVKTMVDIRILEMGISQENIVCVFIVLHAHGKVYCIVDYVYIFQSSITILQAEKLISP